MAKGFVSAAFFLVIYLAIFVPHFASTTVPAIFVLGDSTADVGTNSMLPESLARADFPFYGIDFPNSRPTGRFSNGFNSADFLAKLVGFKRSPQPFLYLSSLKSGLRRRMFRGVNFASAASGLLDITGKTEKIVPLPEQIAQLASVISNRTAVMGQAATQAMLSESLFCISIGSNDIFGYFLTNSTVPPEQYIGTLISSYEGHLKTIYNLGARKFGIISVPPIGCCPSQRLYNATGGCFEPANAFARAFHSALDTLLTKICSELPGLKYSLGNTYEMTVNVIENPSPFNFTNVEAACCGSGRLNGEQPCTPKADLCSNRNEYLFWDLYHPTHAASKLAALTLYGGGPRFVTPINFAQLAA
ncbi:hypothetical protein RJ639_005320 [Escallonia herrerae]|uniref:GDSL esterase/lipase n=1 Tax=Escallonia herrerae TaxID=1293975 RepID=A0AA88VVV9_9ASTE|nr:hypothetical protein RJ639_005320 [Escallonia herrerae]